MENIEINIPQEAIDLCRQFVEVAIKNKMNSFSGKFHTGSNGHFSEISFGWQAGRHETDTNKLSISSQVNIFTKVVEPLNPLTN